MGVASLGRAVTNLLDGLKTALADRYTILQELGRGGMASVYLGRMSGVIGKWPSRFLFSGVRRSDDTEDPGRWARRRFEFRTSL